MSDVTHRRSFFVSLPDQVRRYEKDRVFFPSISAIDTAQQLQDFGYEAARAKAKAAVLGAFVADAAALGLYRMSEKNVRKTLEAARRAARPEFFPRSDKHLTANIGDLSPMGVVLLPLLDTLVGGGGFCPKALTKANLGLTRGQRGYLDPLFLQVQDQVAAGLPYPYAAVPDNSSHALIPVPLLVARYAGKQELRLKLQEAIAVLQNSPAVVQSGLAFAAILEQIVLGRPLLETLIWAVSNSSPLSHRSKRWIQEVLQVRDSAKSECPFDNGDHLPACMQSALHIALTSGDYRSAVQKAILQGGESCTRAQAVGALMAAQEGLESIPEEWMITLTKHDDIEGAVDKVLGQRVYFEAL
eukprot:jgi/Botrbrau1/16148/Bobra.0281s0005.1